jgi:hypothetical protein
MSDTGSDLSGSDLSGSDPSGQARSSWAPVLIGAGFVYAALGALLVVVFFLGGIQSSLFPTGWLFPAVLLVTGALMAARRRFDIVATLWGSLTLLGVLVYVNALDLGLDDAAAFDATLIVAGFGLLVLVLRPAFRD